MNPESAPSPEALRYSSLDRIRLLEELSTRPDVNIQNDPETLTTWVTTEDELITFTPTGVTRSPLHGT